MPRAEIWGCDLTTHLGGKSMKKYFPETSCNKRTAGRSVNNTQDKQVVRIETQTYEPNLYGVHSYQRCVDIWMSVPYCWEANHDYFLILYIYFNTMMNFIAQMTSMPAPFYVWLPAASFLFRIQIESIGWDHASCWFFCLCKWCPWIKQLVESSVSAYDCQELLSLNICSLQQHRRLIVEFLTSIYNLKAAWLLHCPLSQPHCMCNVQKRVVWYGLFMHFCDSNHETTRMQLGQLQ